MLNMQGLFKFCTECKYLHIVNQLLNHNRDITDIVNSLLNDPELIDIIIYGILLLLTGNTILQWYNITNINMIHLHCCITYYFLKAHVVKVSIFTKKLCVLLGDLLNLKKRAKLIVLI